MMINMLETIFYDVITSFCNYGLMAMISGAIIILLMMLLTWMNGNKSINRKKKDIKKEIIKKYFLFYTFYVYCFILISITILSREPGSRRSVDLHLFSTFSNNLWENIFPVENLLLFIPLGYLLPLLWKRLNNVIATMLSGLLFSVMVEVIQYLTQRGYFQTDDIIINLLGTVIGYLCYYCLKRIKMK